MKHVQRLDDARLAEVLNERGMADLEAIRELLQASQQGGMPFAEALVTGGLIEDWDLSRVVCEVFQLPFMPIDAVKADLTLWEQMDADLLRQHSMVPISRFRQVVTIAMPGLVPADVLAMLAASSDLVVMPVVGTVETNRRWILENGPEGDVQAQVLSGSAGWGAMFDEADAAVQLDLDGSEGEGDDDVQGAIEAIDEIAADVEAELEELGDELEELEFTEGEDDAAADVVDVDPPSLVEGGGRAEKKTKKTKRKKGKGGADAIDLPPMPEFG